MSFSFPNDWYWQVLDTNPTTQVFESKSGVMVSNTAVAFTSWMAGVVSDPTNTGLVASITAIASNGGLIRLTVPGQASTWITGQSKTVTGVGGAGAANGVWTVTVISENTVDLQGSTYNAGDTVSGVIGSGKVRDTLANLTADINGFAQANWLNNNTQWSTFTQTSAVNIFLSNPPSGEYDINMTAPGQAVIMPQANFPNSVPIGGEIVFNNTGANDFNVHRYPGGTPIGTARVGNAIRLRLTSANGSIGNWTQFPIISSGQLPLVRGGTNADLSATGGTHQFLKQSSAGAAVTVGQPAFSDLSGAATAAQLPNPSASTLGGIESLASASHQWINQISTAGVPSATQPTTNDVLASATNDSAVAGYVGELISATVASGSSISLTTVTPVTVTSISLTAGDWDVSGIALFTAAGTTTINNIISNISTTNNTLDVTVGKYNTFPYFNATIPAGDPSVPTPTVRLSLSGTTTVYLIVDATFGVSTLKAYGFLRARRVR